MTPNDIQKIIDRVKKMPNSLHRNKTVSHLEDAKAHAYLLNEAPLPEAPPEGECTCVMGARDRNCPAHGSAR